MSSRSDLHMEVGRLSGENSSIRRSEARLKSELVFAEDRINSLREIVEEFRYKKMIIGPENPSSGFAIHKYLVCNFGIPQ